MNDYKADQALKTLSQVSNQENGFQVDDTVICKIHESTGVIVEILEDNAAKVEFQTGILAGRTKSMAYRHLSK